MTFEIRDPAIPDFARFKALRARGKALTMLRRMELELISDLDLHGDVLDFGGGQLANYTRLLPPDLSLRSVNISAEFKPTDLVEIGAPLPYDPAAFDAVITFNVLEHIQDDIGALTEVTRVLKPGGELHIIVPWIYPVHGHPDDFHRHTPSWWFATLQGLGYANGSLLPLVFGRRTSALLIKGRGDKSIRGLVETFAAALDITEARLRFKGGTHYVGRRGETVWSSAPGWYIRATKAPA